jgi:hypothetical protein
VKKILVALGIFLILVFVQGTLSFAGDYKNCVQMGKIPHQFNLSTLQNNYEIHVQCSRQYGENMQNYEKHSMTHTASWDGKTKKATENIDDHFTYYHDGVKSNDVHYKKAVYADCPDDPWLNQVTCTNASISEPLPMDWVFYPPYPISARLLPASERQFLRKELVALQRKLAPEIKLPKQNGKFSNGQMVFEAKASVPDEDDPSTWDVEIELNMDPSQPAPHNIPLKAIAHMTGLHTAWKYMDLPYNGFWLVRGRSKSPKHVSDWSNQVRFEIAGSKGPQFQIPSVSLKTSGASSGKLGQPPLPAPTIKSPTKGQIITGATVNIWVVLSQGSGTSQVNLEFEHNSQPLQSAPLWQKVPVLSGYNTASYPSGYSLTKSKFPKMGKWRVRASSPNTAWCSPVDFELK